MFKTAMASLVLVNNPVEWITGTDQQWQILNTLGIKITQRLQLKKMSLSVLIVGVFGNAESVQLSANGKTIFTSKFQSSKFFSENTWVGQTRTVDLALLNVDDVFEGSFSLRDTIQRVVFVGLAQKEKKPEENGQIFDLTSQYSSSASENSDFVALNQVLRGQIEKVVEAAKKDKKSPEAKLVVYLEDFDGHLQAAAEGAALGNWKFELDTEKFLTAQFGKDGFLLNGIKIVPGASESDFKRGIVYGSSQLFSRYLIELPANYLTPTKYCQLIKEKIEKYSLFASSEFISSKVQVLVHDEAWAQEKKMGSFLSVTAGTSEPAKVLELIFTNNSTKKADEYDLALLGKGITFDSGGISLKPGEGMKEMKGDMGG